MLQRVHHQDAWGSKCYGFLCMNIGMMAAMNDGGENVALQMMMTWAQ
jgi:hypothetical protein